MTVLALALAALATHRLTRLIVDDTITEPIRWRILAQWPAAGTAYTDEWLNDDRTATIYGAPVEPADNGGTYTATTPHWAGELVVCPWCVGWWVAVAVCGTLAVSGAVTMPTVLWALTPWAVASAASVVYTYTG